MAATPAAIAAMRPGGVFLAYVPTTVQVAQTVEGLRASGQLVPDRGPRILITAGDVEAFSGARIRVLSFATGSL